MVNLQIDTSDGGLLVPASIIWLIRLRNIFVTNDDGYVPLVVNTLRPFPHSLIITGFITRVTRWMPLGEQELLTFPKHMSSSPVFGGVRVTRSLVLCVVFCRSFFVLFRLAIVLSVLRFAISDYPFGIFKLFLYCTLSICYQVYHENKNDFCIPGTKRLSSKRTRKTNWTTDLYTLIDTLANSLKRH